MSAITAGGTHTCALASAGGVKCWAHDWLGDLGDGSQTDRSSPVDVVGLTSGVSAIVAGLDHTCAVMSGGAINRWGKNTFGELGNGSVKTRTPKPVKVLFSTSKAGPITTAWLAKVGASAENGTAKVTTVTTGTGSIGLKLVRLRPSSTLPVAVHKGTCAAVGPVLFRLASITTSSAGAAARSASLPLRRPGPESSAPPGSPGALPRLRWPRLVRLRA